MTAENNATDQPKGATLVKTENGYNFWKFDTHIDNERIYWNITPCDAGVPNGGYYDAQYIERIKHQRF